MTPQRWLYAGLLLLTLLLAAYLLGRWDLPLWGAAGWALGSRRDEERYQRPLPEPAGEREDRRLEVAREAAEGSSGVEDLAERHGMPVLSGRVGAVKSLDDLVEVAGDIPAGPLVGASAWLDDEEPGEAMR